VLASQAERESPKMLPQQELKHKANDFICSTICARGVAANVGPHEEGFVNSFNIISSKLK
jgi:hypothetical protein